MDLALYIAAEFGNVDVLIQNKDKIVVEVTPNHNTVLHIASQFGNKECVSKILSIHPSLLFRVNLSGESALHLATKNGHYDVVLTLISCASSLDALDLESEVGAVKEMLRLTNENGDTALHEAVRYSRYDVVEFLTKDDPEYSYGANNDGETPLYIAVEGGFHELVEVILKTCKSPAYGGPGGRTVLHGAIISKNQVVIKKLVDWNKSLVKKADENGQTPLHYAAWLEEEGNNIATQLLEADNSVTYVADNDKNTALHLAVMTGNEYIFKEIESRTPDCWEIVNGKRQNILHIALEYGWKDIVEYILKNNRGINTLITQKDVDGNTPLHLMAASNCFVPEIINHGMVAKNALNKKNLTPLDMVADDNIDVKDALIEAGATWSWRKEMSRSQDEGKKTFTMEDREAVKKADMEKLTTLRRTFEVNMIVATLIVTVTFAAGFTMPGGYNQSGTTNPIPGMAVLSRKSAFQAFMISDAIALLLSCVAIFLNFWGTLFEDQQTLKNFVVANMLLVTAAIGAMMIAFSSATYVVLAQSSSLAIATCLIGVISIPISILLLIRLSRLFHFLVVVYDVSLSVLSLYL